MKIKRYFAADMRQAIRKVRDEQGPDAVILSNRKVSGGIEIVVAIDYDEALVQRAAEQAQPSTTTAAPAQPKPQAVRPDPLPEGVTRPRFEELEKNPVRGGTQVSAEIAAALKKRAQENQPAVPAPAVTPKQTTVENKGNQIEWLADPNMQAMRQEIHELRDLLQNQFAHLAYGELKRNQPQRIELAKRMDALGLTQDLVDELFESLGQFDDIEYAWRQVQALLAYRIPVTDDDILNDGGVVALIGSTGVGKTTTVAKLAARFALRHGQRNVALVTTDGYRIGGHEQLHTYGRILGVPVHSAATQEDLAKLLHNLMDKRLVLIDTAGMGQRDVRLAQQFATLRGVGQPIRTYLALSATTQTSVLDETARVFDRSALAGCIVTKTDEAADLGGVISILARHRLPLAYFADGQRVPEDLHPARAHGFVQNAMNLMRQDVPGQDGAALVERFGGMAANAHV